MSLTIPAIRASQALKQETCAVHENTEGLLLPRLQQIRSLQDYADILKMFFGYFSPLEDSIQQQLDETVKTELGARRNSALILCDLKALGETKPALPLCQQLPSITGNSEALGALYVLEGSTLGGRHITKLLLAHPGIPLSVNQVNFFSGYKEETGIRWKKFLEVLDRETDLEKMIECARQTFILFSNWIERTLYAKK